MKAQAVIDWIKENTYKNTRIHKLSDSDFVIVTSQLLIRWSLSNVKIDRFSETVQFNHESNNLILWMILNHEKVTVRSILE